VDVKLMVLLDFLIHIWWEMSVYVVYKISAQ
jgi:hypothetical protein